MVRATERSKGIFFTIAEEQKKEVIKISLKKKQTQVLKFLSGEYLQNYHHLPVYFLISLLPTYSGDLLRDCRPCALHSIFMISYIHTSVNDITLKFFFLQTVFKRSKNCFLYI